MMNLSIIVKHPIPTPEGGFETTAHEYIPGETIEQLASRVFYEVSQKWNGKTSFPVHVMRNMMGTFYDIAEIRLVKGID